MRIFHAAPQAILNKIESEGVIIGQAQVIYTYDDYGQEVEEYENRAYICTDPEDGEIIRQALTNRRGETHVLGEFETAQDIINLNPDPRFAGKGFYTTGDIPLRNNKNE